LSAGCTVVLERCAVQLCAWRYQVSNNLSRFSPAYEEMPMRSTVL
jgi:hypothetical protein